MLKRNETAAGDDSVQHAGESEEVFAAKIRILQEVTVVSAWQMVVPYKVLVFIYVSTARSSTLGKYFMKIYRCRVEDRGDDSLLIEMFRSEILSTYPELLLQAQPVVGSPGVVKPLQMALQRAHI